MGFSEQVGKEANDALLNRKRGVWVNGPVIVGAGPSGLATAACLKEQGVPSIILEKADCIASLWQHRTYNRLKLHLPKQFCELPRKPFPEDFPTYPSKSQFIDYLESYNKEFELNPRFNECVQSAKYDETCGLWRVSTKSCPKGGLAVREFEYICRWLIVATGENAEPVIPDIAGSETFKGQIIHACEYKNGAKYVGKKVLVVGCGNSGMEVSLDLANHNANPSMVVRSQVHVLPREMFGKSTFGVAMAMMRWLPLWLVDRLILFIAWLMLGNTGRYGLPRPKTGPIELKNVAGKTPVLDIGALKKIRSGHIKVVPAVECFTTHGAKFADGTVQDFDAVVWATGYKSNVPYWLEKCDFFSRSGMPKTPFPNGWKGGSGLYAVGFTRRGLLGTSMDARRIAKDIGTTWKEDNKQTKTNQFKSCHRRCISQF
ncbi:hypothetical protein SUGI_1111000 [Cryptomeria japonica]|uniref:probable indole-3-pyruvate monooxygenase YUCCA5 n=1 Tax=Cryptomeria japonica TaxID=3369 RepID=UPI002414CE5A|nr:probable indole-3-pyruvate monooxygenase YUCCA5 [Cryptomeria japonica]GLJ52229.1 hypothetical protein SUGI_1111000 [Cryptomeria japonica]